MNDFTSKITAKKQEHESKTADNKRTASLMNAITSTSGEQLKLAKEIRELLKGRQVVTMQAATASVSSVAGSASSVSLLASNTSRKGATITNDSTADLYVKLGATASTTSYTIKLKTDDYYEVPYGYTGVIDGIWGSATGSARITEIS